MRAVGFVGRLVWLPVTLPVGLFRVWLHNAQSRRDLRQLPTHLLNDVGMTRAQAEAESLKRFWMK